MGVGTVFAPTSDSNTHSMDFEQSSSQYLSIADASQTGLDITGSITIEAWVKLESLPADGGNNPIVTKYNSNKSYFLAFRNDGGVYKIRWIISDDGTTQESELSSAITLNTATWYYVAIVWTGGTGAYTFYFGSGVPTAVNSSSTTMTSIANTDAPFYIGTQAGGGSPAEFFDGLIDEVRVWNTTKTLGQIQASYNVQLAGNEANLQGYWKLNNTLTDSTANGNTLTNNNAAVFSADIPF